MSALAKTFRPKELFLSGGVRCLQQGLRGAREKEESEGPVRTGLLLLLLLSRFSRVRLCVTP